MEGKCNICIGRELGSGGRMIGSLLAEKLGYDYFDKELIMLAAEESGYCKEIFEKVDEKTNFFTNAFCHWSPEIASSIPMFGNRYLNNDTLFKIQSDVILNKAQKGGNVFVGRCADYILRNLNNSINIFVHAPRKFRVDVIAKKRKIEAQEALRLINRSDKSRSSYYNYYTNKTWGSVSSYHLCLDASCLNIEDIVSLIMDYIQKHKV